MSEQITAENERMDVNQSIHSFDKYLLSNYSVGVGTFIYFKKYFYYMNKKGIPFKNIYLLILAAAGLSCGTQDFQSSLWHAES